MERSWNSQGLIINCLNAFGIKPAGLRILAVVPSILGGDGSATNERQILRELCGSRCFIITLIRLTLLKELRRLISGLQAEHGSYDVVSPLPVIPIPNMWII
jgi:hypothetical protein